jgi:hypothetical protein
MSKSLPSPRRTLVSLAILKTNADKAETDYVDFLAPFVSYVLDKNRQVVISPAEVKKMLLSEFGLDIPSSSIEFILTRLRKAGVLIKEHETLRLADRVEIKDVKAIQSQKNKEIDIILEYLVEFVSKQHHVTWSTEDAIDALLNYLSVYSVPCLETFLSSTSLPNLPNTRENSCYLVNSFIRHLHENRLGLMGQLVDLVKGMMFANALLYEDIPNLASKLKDATFYLDTPLLVGLLGFGDDYSKESLVEMVSLVQKLGGNFSIFEHTYVELEAVVASGLASSDNPNIDKSSALVRSLRSQHRSRSDLKLNADQIDENLRTLNISIKPNVVRENKYQIDEIKLAAMLKKKPGYRYENTMQRDVDSISFVYQLRKGNQVSKIERCRSVLVTTNEKVIRTAYWFGQEESLDGLVPSVISAYALTNLAWLKAPLEKPDLPELEIMSFCYSSLVPSDSFWNSFLKELDRLESSGELAPLDCDLLRTDPKVYRELMDVTVGLEQNITSKTIDEVLNRVTQEQKELLAKVEREKQEALAVKDDRIGELEKTVKTLQEIEKDKEKEQRYRIRQRAEKSGQWVALVVFVILCAMVLVGALFSSLILTVWSSLPKYWLIVTLPFVVIGVLGIVVGVSVKSLSAGLETWITDRKEDGLLRVACLTKEIENE